MNEVPIPIKLVMTLVILQVMISLVLGLFPNMPVSALTLAPIVIAVLISSCVLMKWIWTPRK